MSEAASVLPKPKKSVALSGTAAGNTALCTVGRTGNDRLGPPREFSWHRQRRPFGLHGQARKRPRNSTSTGTPSGSSATPTAERAWRPASPKTAPKNSLAPLITIG